MTTTTGTPSAPPAPRQHPGIVALRIGWIAVQILVAFLFAQQGELFFYQGF